MKNILLKSKNFNFLLPIFSEMNGNLIHELYRMCLSNRESMFHSLQKEISILNSNNQPLTFLIYLRFLDEIQKHIPVSDTDHFFRDPTHSGLSRLSPYPTRFKSENCF